MEVLSVVALGIKLRRCWLLMEVLWLWASSSGVADGSAVCCGFGHQARALLAADGSGERK
jgi:hypothetical protein